MPTECDRMQTSLVYETKVHTKTLSTLGYSQRSSTHNTSFQNRKYSNSTELSKKMVFQWH